MAVLAIKLLLFVWTALLILIGSHFLEDWAKSVWRSAPKSSEREDRRKAMSLRFDRG
jgi:hypothetical protein